MTGTVWDPGSWWCFRVGQHLGFTLYAQLTAVPSLDDVYLATFTSPELAAVAVTALNGTTVPGLSWTHVGRLIYPRQGGSSDECPGT